jgi:hypothetical protein
MQFRIEHHDFVCITPGYLYQAKAYWWHENTVEARNPKHRSPQTPRSAIGKYPMSYMSSMVNYSILIFMSPSFAFSMPIRPTLFGPRVGVMLILPPLLERSPVECPLMDVSLPVLVELPHKVLSRCAGDCDMMGLL